MTIDLFRVYRKIDNTDIVMVATFTAGYNPYVFIGTFNPKLQKAKLPEPLQFCCEIHNNCGPTLFYDRCYSTAFATFFEQNPSFDWLLNWDSDEWQSLKLNAKPIEMKND